MRIITAQPDELYFAWQSHVQLENLRELGFDLTEVWILVGTNNYKSVEPKWQELVDEYKCNVVYYEDKREQKAYMPSIRPFLLAKFFGNFPHFENEYFFYIDCDVIFTRELEFEGMMDGRVHVSRVHYASYDYVEKKGVPSLASDMLGFVGIDRQTAYESDANMGGVHYLFPRTTAGFWKILENKMELMHSTYYQRETKYKIEMYEKHFVPWYTNLINKKKLAGETIEPLPDYTTWLTWKQDKGGYDFQIWCADLFCISWELALRGIPVYANPMLDFVWPGDPLEELKKKAIFHNSGIMPDAKNGWLHKQDYKQYEPFLADNLSLLGYIDFNNGYKTAAAQRYYIDYIEKIGAKIRARNEYKNLQELRPKAVQELPVDFKLPTISLPSGQVIEATEPIHTTPSPQGHFVSDGIWTGVLPDKSGSDFDIDKERKVSCVMTTYGRHYMVERSIEFWLLQDYGNKELIIYNTAETPLTLASELLGKGIRIVNNGIDLVTHKPYDNVGAVRRDAVSFATGDWYICWDDDDAYLPWHISQGMRWLSKNPHMKAYMPAQSYYTPDGFNTIELARNSMEASCIVDMQEIRTYGFANSNGAEHLTWRRGLLDRGLLTETYEVTPMESYAYVWGEPQAPRKQSGYINDQNNFENHKLANVDFGTRPLGQNEIVQRNVSDIFLKLSLFAAHRDQMRAIANYL